MTVPSVACTNCGKPFTTDDLRGTSCKYCGTLLAHRARAQQQVAVINQMMADRNGNGIPDMYEGVVANAQANAINQAFGVQPFGAPPYTPYGAPNNLYAANMQIAQTVTKTVSTITIVIVAAVAVMMLGGIAVGFLMFFAVR